MAERTIASVLKTVEALRSPGVRIPLSPLCPASGHRNLRTLGFGGFLRFGVEWLVADCGVEFQVSEKLSGGFVDDADCQVSFGSSASNRMYVFLDRFFGSGSISPAASSRRRIVETDTVMS